MRPLIGFVLAASFLAHHLAAQTVTVSALVPPVMLTRNDDFRAVPLEVDAVLNESDELRGGAGSSVQLDCDNGATQTLSEDFHVLVNVAGSPTSCSIDLTVGRAVASVPSDGSAEASMRDATGALAMIATHTLFGLKISADDSSDADAFVIEGTAEVQGLTENALELAAGQSINSRARVVAQLAPNTLDSVASAYAKLDVSRIGQSSNPHTETVLKAKWVDALREPSAQTHAALAATQRSLAIGGSRIAAYQVDRAANAVVVQPATQTFEAPMAGQYRLDYCLSWGQQCGQPAVDRWCSDRGFARASAWAPAWDIGTTTPTLVVADNRVCSEGYCDGFATVTCAR